MVIYIRADASTKIGTGHVMRCLTLADALYDRGARVIFVSRCTMGNLHTYIQQRGYPVHALPKANGAGIKVGYADWLEVDWQQDAEQTMAAISEAHVPIDWLVVDHYALDASWENSVRPYVRNIMVIDDLANRVHDCDLLLDQSLVLDQAQRYSGLVPETCTKLFAPLHALLRPDFARLRATLPKHTGEIRRILVFFGGADSGNDTEKAIIALQMLHDPTLSIDVVMGEANIHVDRIQKLSVTLPGATLYKHVDNFAELMAHADLAIGGGGMTAIERCCIGLPSITVCVAENQLPACIQLAKDGRIFYLGLGNTVTVMDILETLRDLRRNPDSIRRASLASLLLTDGQGAERVASYLIQ